MQTVSAAAVEHRLNLLTTIVLSTDAQLPTMKDAQSAIHHIFWIPAQSSVVWSFAWRQKEENVQVARQVTLQMQMEFVSYLIKIV